MKRNPELAHKVSLMPDIEAMRHEAIDKVTSASIQAQLLARYDELSATDEIDAEIKLNELLDDAGYAFRKYLREKISRYENELHKTLQKGNDFVKRHQEDLTELINERGI